MTIKEQGEHLPVGSHQPVVLAGPLGPSRPSWWSEQTWLARRWGPYSPPPCPCQSLLSPLLCLVCRILFPGGWGVDAGDGLYTSPPKHTHTSLLGGGDISSPSVSCFPRAHPFILTILPWAPLPLLCFCFSIALSVWWPPLGFFPACNTPPPHPALLLGQVLPLLQKSLSLREALLRPPSTGCSGPLEGLPHCTRRLVI